MNGNNKILAIVTTIIVLLIVVLFYRSCNCEECRSVLIKQNDSLRKEIERINLSTASEYEEMRTNFNVANTEKEELENNIVLLKDTIRILCTKIYDLEKGKKHNETEIAKLRKYLDEAIQKQEKLVNDVTIIINNRNDIEQYTAITDSIEGKGRGQLDAFKKEANTYFYELRKSKEETENFIEDAKIFLVNLDNSQKIKKEIENEKSQQRISELESQLRVSNEQLSNALDQLQNQEEELNNYVSDISILNVQNTQLKKDTATLRSTIKEKDTQLAKANRDNAKLRKENKRLWDIINIRPSFEIDFKRNFKIKQGKNKDIPFVIHKNDNAIKMNEQKTYTLYIAVANINPPKEFTTISSGSGFYVEPFDTIRFNGEVWFNNNKCYIYNSKVNFEWNGNEVEGKISISSTSKTVIEKSDFRYDYLIFENNIFVTGSSNCSMADRVGDEIKEQ